MLINKLLDARGQIITRHNYRLYWAQRNIPKGSNAPGGRPRDSGGRASDGRKVDPFNMVSSQDRQKGGFVEEHTAIDLQSILANFDGILTVLISNTARTTHCSGFLWEVGGCKGKKGRGGRCHRVRPKDVTVRQSKRLPPAAWSSNSAYSSAIAALSWSYSVLREPQL